MCCEGQGQVQSTINPLSTPLRSKSLRNQAELHSLGVKVDLELGCMLFSQTARLCFPTFANHTHSSAGLMHNRRHGNWLPSCLEVPRPTTTSRIDFESVRDTTWEVRKGVVFRLNHRRYYLMTRNSQCVDQVLFSTGDSMTKYRW